MQRLWRFFALPVTTICLLLFGALLPGCNGGGNSGPFVPGGGGAQLHLSRVTGQVLAPGAAGPETPVANALVRLVRVDKDGDILAEIGRDTADANGNYQINFPTLVAQANLWLVATGGNASRSVATVQNAGANATVKGASSAPGAKAIVTPRFFSEGLIAALTEAIVRITPVSTAATQILQERLAQRLINLADIDINAANNFKKAALNAVLAQGPLPPVSNANEAVRDYKGLIEQAIQDGENVSLQLNFIVQQLLSGERIYFDSGGTVAQEGRSDFIYSIRPDGTGYAYIAQGLEPDISPDGRKIIFRDFNKLVVANVDGTNPRVVLTENSFRLKSPVWAPDNRRIAYESSGAIGPGIQIWVLDTASGSKSQITGLLAPEFNTTNLTSNPLGLKEETRPASEQNNTQPCWTPDGASLVFHTDRHFLTNTGNGTRPVVQEFYRINVTTRAETRITKHSRAGNTSSIGLGAPIVLPNGQSIAWAAAGIRSIAATNVVSPQNPQATINLHQQIVSLPQLAIAPARNNLEVSPNGHAFVLNGVATSLQTLYILEARSGAQLQALTTPGFNPSWGTVPAPIAPPLPPTTTPTPTPIPPGQNLVCIQQGNNSLSLNLSNGQYTFCAGGTSFAGTGTVTSGVTSTTFAHNTADRRVAATLNLGTRQATASLQAPVGTTRASISDDNYADGACGTCSGSGTQTRNLTAPSGRIITMRLNGNNSSSPFPSFLEAGDHDEGGHKTLQGFIGFPFSGTGLPTDPNKITNVRLVLTENRDPTTGSEGQPFSQLGRLFAERIAQTEFQQISTATLPVSDITRTSRIVATNTTGGYAADVTAIFKEFVRTSQDVANFRLRFETLENNDGNNDLTDFFTTGTSQPRLEITFTP